MNMKGITLADTVKWMLSDDYKERLKAEYYQTAIRYNLLKTMTLKIMTWKNKDDPEAKPISSLELLEDQAIMMKYYLQVLAERADIEGINLDLE